MTNKSKDFLKVLIIWRILVKLTLVTTILLCYTLLESHFLRYSILNFQLSVPVLRVL